MRRMQTKRSLAAPADGAGRPLLRAAGDGQLEAAHQKHRLGLAREFFMEYYAYLHYMLAPGMWSGFERVQSARRNCVDVWPYLTDVLRRLPMIPPTDTVALKTLLPDHWVQIYPEHRLTEREEESREAQARRRRKRAARRAAAG